MNSRSFIPSSTTPYPTGIYFQDFAKEDLIWALYLLSLETSKFLYKEMGQ
jgi:hypothetical protein